MDNSLSHKDYLKIALPFIFSTITQPLLGAVDTAVVGRLGDAAYIGGVSVGTVIFNTMYWLFGFLRVSTTGFSAQAENCHEKKTTAFFQPFIIAVAVSFLFLLFQSIIFKTTMYLLNPELMIKNVVKTYFYILIWGAPFVLVNYVILGWLMGQTYIKASLSMQIIGNVVNIILDFLFVFYFNFGVKGVAFSTLFSQILSTFIGIYFMKKYYKFNNIDWKSILNKKNLIDIILVNFNLMLRTACLLIQRNVFTATSAAFGTTILAANAILLQIVAIISYMFDGLANASSVFAGKAIGQKSNKLMKFTWKITAQWTGFLVIITSIIYFFTSNYLIEVFTNLILVSSTAQKYTLWVLLFPLIASTGLTFYGIFTGSSVTKPIFTSTFLSLLVFLVVCKFTIPTYQNHGVWIALLSFYFSRTVFLIPNLNKTIKIIK